MDLLGQAFSVTAVLPQTGTVDDSRIFAHLHAVQDLSGKGPVINAIEVVGCCQEISNGLVQKINQLLPDAKVVTITQIVDSQIKMNQMMSRLSLIFLVIIVLVGGASIANYMYANVFERRREIGTLMALGADSFLVLRIFLLKALLLGLAGGVGGYLLGTVLAVTLGPRLAGVPVLPMPILALWAVGISVGPRLGGQLLPRPAGRPARSLCHAPGDLTHVANGKRHQELPASRPARDRAGRRHAGDRPRAISWPSSAPAAAARARCCLMLGGMLSPTSGRVLLEGQSIYDLSADDRADCGRRRSASSSRPSTWCPT